jgi:hypothetical protein
MKFIFKLPVILVTLLLLVQAHAMETTTNEKPTEFLFDGMRY